MSYEGEMLKKFKMPLKNDVEEALLLTLFRHGGTVREFNSEETVVDEIADNFGLSVEQRSVMLETVYRKQNRLKHSSLWHRLLFRAADSLSKQSLVSRPTETFNITKKREWMLTENGFDKALRLSRLPSSSKEALPTKSCEVERIARKLIEYPPSPNYDPIDKTKSTAKVSKETRLRSRAFRQAVMEIYNFSCAVCGLKIRALNTSAWEVEAAHIVPHSFQGKDDIYNGIALCRLHHWAFDSGWLTLSDEYAIQISSLITSLPHDFGRMREHQIFHSLTVNSQLANLPQNANFYPHKRAMLWHRENIFYS